jgi:hypothetical protein
VLFCAFLLLFVCFGVILILLIVVILTLMELVMKVIYFILFTLFISCGGQELDIEEHCSNVVDRLVPEIRTPADYVKANVIYGECLESYEVTE